MLMPRLGATKGWPVQLGDHHLQQDRRGSDGPGKCYVDCLEALLTERYEYSAYRGTHLEPIPP